MLMGLRNAPAIHQWHVTSALHPYIGKICHIYLNNIIIWSDTVEEHCENVQMILAALCGSQLYCNPLKTHLFQTKVNLLGHHISTCGIEANTKKMDCIIGWPRPHSAKEVHQFCGLVHYIAHFLPQITEHTWVLTELTTKECNMTFAVLLFGKTWELAWPVAFDLMTFKWAELNYPVHEKEMLAIIWALDKWCSDLIGVPVPVYMDHKSLENFDTQKELSCHQVRWMEFILQYDYKIVYIKGKENTVADALSHMNFNPDMHATVPYPPCSEIIALILAKDSDPLSCAHILTDPATNPVNGPFVSSMLSITADAKLLFCIQKNYIKDPWCKHLLDAEFLPHDIHETHGLLYTGNRLIIPCVSKVHDVLGHFSFAKTYGSLWESFYWPNMCHDLE